MATEYDYLKNGTTPVLVDGAKRAISDEEPDAEGNPGTPISEKYATKEGFTGHVDDKNNPHSVTKSQVGLGNVDNTSDANKPISTATQTELDKKEDVANKVNQIDDTTATNIKYPTGLAVKNYVNDKVQTATANFLGSWDTWASVPEQESGFRIPPTKNDYIVVLADETHSGQTWRYKYELDTRQNAYSKDDWGAEYKINDTPFTQEQMNAINSGITSDKVATYNAYQSQINAKANDSAVVHKTGDEVIDGDKTFNDGISIKCSDTAVGSNRNITCTDAEGIRLGLLRYTLNSDHNSVMLASFKPGDDSIGNAGQLIVTTKTDGAKYVEIPYRTSPSKNGEAIVKATGDALYQAKGGHGTANVATSAWKSEGTANYPYRATVSVSGIDANCRPSIAFLETEAVSGNFSPVCDSLSGGIYIYAKTIPSGQITVSYGYEK